MVLLTKEQRKEIFERVCMRFHEDGVKRLEEVGHFEKFLPMFHYRLAEPFENYPHIFVTELFGNTIVPPIGLHKMVRVQYHGDYNGLINVLATYPGESMIEGYEDKGRYAHLDFSSKVDETGYRKLILEDGQRAKERTLNDNPSFSVIGLERKVPLEFKELFDNSLRYLDRALIFALPGSIKTNWQTEQISSTYRVV